MVETPWTELERKLAADLEPAERTAGLHFALIAPTRGGKTTLVTKGIIPIYHKVEVPILVLDTTADPKLRQYGDPIPRFGKMTGIHRLSIGDLSSDSKTKVYKVLGRAYKQGDILIYCDEIRHVCDREYLGMKAAMESLWLFGGKHGVTIGGATQAPRWVPSAFYDQSKAHFFFRIRDKRARKRIEEISGDTDTLESTVPHLQKYQFAYVDPEGDVSVSKYDLRTT